LKELKNLLVFFLIVLAGIIGGIFLIDFLGRSFMWQNEFTQVILAAYVGLFLVLSLIIGRDTHFMEKSSPDSRIRGKSKNYAWLIPETSDPVAGFPITKKLMVIGREPTVDILINDDSISKKHAHLISLPGGFMLKDLDSKNGTFINNKRINESYLCDDDKVTLGDVKFIFKCSKVKDAPAGEADIKIDFEGEADEYVTKITTGTRHGSASRLRELPGFEPGTEKKPDDPSSGTFTPRAKKNNTNSSSLPDNS